MTDDASTQLRTPRLFLRRFRPSDVEGLRAVQVGPSGSAVLGVGSASPMEQAREFVTTMATAPADVPGEWLQITVARARALFG
jgi:hypothetical protein